METNQQEGYNPAEDDNQGVAQLMAQGEQANQNVGVEQAPQMGMAAHTEQNEANQAPTNESDTEANGVNEEMLAEEDVENRDLTE